jgi:hypothetical protein
MKKKFKTDPEILNLKWSDFDLICFPKNKHVSITQARNFFFLRVVWINCNTIENIFVVDILRFLNGQNPEDLLGMPDVGPKRMQNTIRCLLNAGIHPNDIPKYKKWLKEYNKLHP